MGESPWWAGGVQFGPNPALWELSLGCDWHPEGCGSEDNLARKGAPFLWK